MDPLQYERRPRARLLAPSGTAFEMMNNGWCLVNKETSQPLGTDGAGDVPTTPEGIRKIVKDSLVFLLGNAALGSERRPLRDGRHVAPRAPAGRHARVSSRDCRRCARRRSEETTTTRAGRRAPVLDERRTPTLDDDGAAATAVPVAAGHRVDVGAGRARARR
mmetsp:Transcript_9309/g.38194  ORF Transcript_9309/g.38194 Transcript_9309/m.38194 type:complete len:163 (+) Transcript_9309:15-503(+)